MPLQFPVAGVGSRFLALALDSLIQAAIGIVAFILVAVFGVASGAVQQPLWLVALLIAVLFLLTFAYFAAFEIAWNGQTPGKRMVGIRVVKDSGRPLTPAESIGRNLMRIIDQLPGFYAVAVIVALISPRNKRLGDYVAGSMVVREASFAEVKPVWQAGPAQPPPLPHPAASLLSIEDLTLIDKFLHRRAELAPDVRTRIAEEILARIRMRSGLEIALDATPETILEALAYGRRAAGGYS